MQLKTHLFIDIHALFFMQLNHDLMPVLNCNPHIKSILERACSDGLKDAIQCHLSLSQHLQLDDKKIFYLNQTISFDWLFERLKQAGLSPYFSNFIYTVPTSPEGKLHYNIHTLKKNGLNITADQCIFILQSGTKIEQGAFNTMRLYDEGALDCANVLQYQRVKQHQRYSQEFVFTELDHTLLLNAKTMYENRTLLNPHLVTHLRQYNLLTPYILTSRNAVTLEVSCLLESIEADYRIFFGHSGDELAKLGGQIEQIKQKLNENTTSSNLHELQANLALLKKTKIELVKWAKTTIQRIHFKESGALRKFQHYLEHPGSIHNIIKACSSKGIQLQTYPNSFLDRKNAWMSKMMRTTAFLSKLASEKKPSSNPILITCFYSNKQELALIQSEEKCWRMRGIILFPIKIHPEGSACIQKIQKLHAFIRASHEKINNQFEPGACRLKNRFFSTLPSIIEETEASLDSYLILS